MDATAKKTALRMIPYGLYVLTSQTEEGRVAASTVTWVTQASFEPPLVAVAVRNGSRPDEIIRESGVFALNFLAKGQHEIASRFFKSRERDGDTIGGEPFTSGSTRSPILARAAAFADCRVRETIDGGDHSIFVGEVVDAGVSGALPGRPDERTLVPRDLGGNIFYGG